MQPAADLHRLMATDTDTIPQGLLPFSRKAIVGALLILGAYDVLYVIIWLCRSPQPPFDDFFGLWSFGKFAIANGSAIYDPVALQAFQHVLDPYFSGAYPYPYPPTFLLALAPLGMVPIAPAYIVWIAGTFVLYTLVTLGRDWRSLRGAALLVAPTTLLAIVSGQNGFLTAALLVGGLCNLKPFPMIGGVLLGLLTYKPQFALLAFSVLFAAKEWRAIIAFGLTFVFVVICSSAVFDWSIWLIWAQSISVYRELLQANQSSLYHLMPTVMAGAREVGASQLAGYCLQFVMAIIFAICVWRKFACAIDDRSIAAAIIATMLVTPYAFTYDMPMVAAALAIEWRRRKRHGIPVKLWEALVVLNMSTVIMIMTVRTIPFVIPVLLSIIFGVIAYSNDYRRDDSTSALPATSI